MKTLVLCNDYWHPAETIRTGLAPLSRYGFSFDWLDDAGDWSAEKMAAYPLVVLAKANDVSNTDQNDWMTPEVEQAFVDYVQQGHGLLAIHSGSAGYYRKVSVLQNLLGGLFVHHPRRCEVQIEPKPDHPLAAGSEPFAVNDEHYFMDIVDPQIDVFMTTNSRHGILPGGWTRTEGQGRVCVLTPGHDADVWLHPSYQALLKNCLTWCAGSR